MFSAEMYTNLQIALSARRAPSPNRGSQRTPRLGTARPRRARATDIAVVVVVTVEVNHARIDHDLISEPQIGVEHALLLVNAKEERKEMTPP